MMKHVVKMFSVMAVSICIGALTMGNVVYAAELRAIRCEWCGSTNFTEGSSEPTGEVCIYADPNGHLVPVNIVFRCDECFDTFFGSGLEYEGHDYELDEGTGMLECTGCGDSYKWSRVAFAE